MQCRRGRRGRFTIARQGHRIRRSKVARKALGCRVFRRGRRVVKSGFGEGVVVGRLLGKNAVKGHDSRRVAGLNTLTVGTLSMEKLLRSPFYHVWLGQQYQKYAVRSRMVKLELWRVEVFVG